VEVFYKGKSAPNTGLVIVEIKNYGRVAIKPTDFIEPLQVDMPAGGRVLTRRVSQQNPKDLNGKIELGTEEGTNGSEGIDSVKLCPLLLNRGDSLTIEVLASNVLGKEVAVHARIIDIPKIKRVSSQEKSSAWSWNRFVYGSIGGMGVEFIRISKISSVGSIPWGYIWVSVVIVTMAGVFANAWKDERPIGAIYIGATFGIWISAWTNVISRH
jgi:hypothetical protein